MSSKTQDYYRKICIGVILSSIQFFILSSLSIFFYPENYSFFESPLSSLGFTQVNGTNNLLSSLLFNLSMFVLGIGIILLFVLFFPFNKESFPQQWSGITCSVLGLLSGLGMCGAAITPGDINFEQHIIFAPVTFLFGMIGFFLLGINILSRSKFDNRYSILAFGYVGIAFLSILVIIVGPAYTTTVGLILQTVLHKIIIYSECVVIILLAYGNIGLLKQNH